MKKLIQTAFERRKALNIGGKPAYLDIIGRHSYQETYVFLRTQRRWGKDQVYGIAYDIKKKCIVGLDKFTDKKSASRPPITYGQFYSRWNLRNYSKGVFHFLTEIKILGLTDPDLLKMIGNLIAQ